MGRNAACRQSLKVKLSFLASLIIEILQVRFAHLLPSFAHLLNSIIIRFNVMVGTDKWLGFWFCNWNLVENSIYTVETTSAAPGLFVTVQSWEQQIGEKWFSLKNTSQTRLGLWERSSLQNTEFPPFCCWEVCLALGSWGIFVSVQNFWISDSQGGCDLFLPIYCRALCLCTMGMAYFEWQLPIICPGGHAGIKLWESRR